LSTTPQEDPTTHVADKVAETNKEFLKQIKRLYQGDSGLLPILIGLAGLVIYFQIRSSVFLSAGNITNLFVQATIFILLGMAEIWLLLMGDIDLSAGYMAGVSGAVAVILTNTVHHWPWFVVLPLAVFITSMIGAIWGTIVIRLKLPSFIVTLAGLLILEGVLLYLIDSQGNSGGSLPVQEKVLYNLVNGNLTPLATWLFVGAAVVVLGLMMLGADRNRRVNGLETRPGWVTIAKIIALALAGVALVLIFNTNRSTFTNLTGMPFAIPIDMAVLAVGTFILTKSRAGRYIYAIGGNVEAARRAGINVNRYRLLAFMLSGATSGVAGLLYVSRLNGISSGIEGGTYVLYAVAAAVIGGTSLFGGRGKMIHAVIGGIVIATIANGLALINVSPSGLYVVTGLVLLAAVTVDSVARSGSASR
jgi:D-xylose transport system permease protein